MECTHKGILERPVQVDIVFVSNVLFSFVSTMAQNLQGHSRTPLHCLHWLRRIWQPLALVLCLSSFISCMKLSVVWWHCGWEWVLHDGLHAVVVDAAAGAYSAWRPSEASKRMWRAAAGEARGWLWPQKPQDWSLKFNSVWRRSIYVIDSSTNYPSRSSRHPNSTYIHTNIVRNSEYSVNLSMYTDNMWTCLKRGNIGLHT